VTLKAGDKVKSDEFKVGDKVIVQYRGETISSMRLVKPVVKTR
jgi:NAD-dependent DNA ligase